MKSSSILCLHFVFFGLFHCYTFLNPESVIVQSPEDNDKKTDKIQEAFINREGQGVKSPVDNDEKTDIIQTDESDQKEFISEESPRFSVRKIMKPVRIGSQTYWIEVRKVYVGRGPNSNPSQNFRTPQPNLRTTEETGIMETEDDQQKEFIIEERPRFLVRKFMRPVRIGSQTYWMEVHRVYVNRGQNSNLPWNFRTFRPNFRRTTEKSITDVNREPGVDDLKTQMPPNRIKEHNNNNQGYSETVNASPAATESEGERFENENPITKSPQKTSPDSNFFASIINNFAFKLVETINLKSNFVISPLSIFVALSMCYLGADGNTKAQMEQVLGMNDNAIHGEHFHQGIKTLLSLLLRDSDGYKLFVATGMLLGQNFTVNTQFEEHIKKYYGAELKNLDFKNPESLEIVNGWVAENTRNMITSMLDSPPSPLTRLILLNAVYFEGYWKTMFPPELTRDEKFYSLDGKEKEVSFMTLDVKTFPAFRSDEHQQTFIKLPYQGDQLSMIIALPYTYGEEPMPSVTDEILLNVRDAMEDFQFDIVSIPKFSLEYTKSLKESLQELGITDIFSDNADLRQIRQENDLYVSAIMHKAVVQVNEVGTKAAGVTSVQLSTKSARRNRNFVADHPFAFYIMHEASGLVLFQGKVFNFDAVM